MYIILDGISQSNFKGKLQPPEPVQNFSTIYHQETHRWRVKGHTMKHIIQMLFIDKAPQWTPWNIGVSYLWMAGKLYLVPTPANS